MPIPSLNTVQSNRDTSNKPKPRRFSLVIKPMGPICNLDCTYCFYLEKEHLYPNLRSTAAFKMNDATLEELTRRYITEQDGPHIDFVWQGGEPSLMGIDFFKRALELQKKYSQQGKTVHNAFQTNGILLDDAWCEFLAANNFLIGLSIDGPAELHDRYRLTRSGQPTHAGVMRALKLLQKHKVKYNTLTVVHKELAYKPLDVYHFLKDNGCVYMQFIPLVERIGAAPMKFADPPLLRVLTPQAEVTPWSVEPLQYGEFLCAIFDEWVRHDVGRHFVQIFDVQLAIHAGMGSTLCVFAETCGNALAIEHNGDLYSCDHYVYRDYYLGNIGTRSLQQMVESSFQTQFGRDKSSTLPQYCRNCDVRFACNGECPKHRFCTTPDGEPGLNYLCAGYKRLFSHIGPHMKIMADLLRAGRLPKEIMDIVS